MTNMEWLASLPAREFYDQFEQIKHDKGRGTPDTRLWMIEWLDQEHAETEATMDRRTEVMGWLEGLAQDDWMNWHSDSEVQNTAKAALDLLKEREAVKPIPPTGESDLWKCGKCNQQLFRCAHQRYCESCGRLIKWE